MSWAIIGASVISAGAGVYGSQQAAKNQTRGGQNALNLQREMFNAGLQMNEPQRALGYGALSDIANLYGWALPSYTPISSIASGGGGVSFGANASAPSGLGGPITVQGRKATDTIAGIDKNPFSKHDKAFSAVIDPATGQVNITNMKKAGKEAKAEARAQAYLRGETDKLSGKGMRRIRSTIRDMLDAGYAYDPEAKPPEEVPQAGPTGQPGNMDRFFTSPDYQFRLSEGQKAIDNSAAARGSALSGNALRAQTEFASNLASSEYNNYVNRLLQAAGLGQAATAQGAASAQNFGTTGGNTLQNIGDSRASGVMGAANSVSSAINNGLSLYALQNYLRPPAPTVPTGYTPAPGMGIMPWNGG